MISMIYGSFPSSLQRLYYDKNKILEKKNNFLLLSKTFHHCTVPSLACHDDDIANEETLTKNANFKIRSGNFFR